MNYEGIVGVSMRDSVVEKYRFGGCVRAMFGFFADLVCRGCVGIVQEKRSVRLTWFRAWDFTVFFGSIWTVFFSCPRSEKVSVYH